jgi:hypothetical protein
LRCIGGDGQHGGADRDRYPVQDTTFPSVNMPSR